MARPKKINSFVSYVVTTPMLSLGGCRITINRGSVIEIDRENAMIRFNGQEYTSANDVAILMRNFENAENPLLVDDSSKNRSKHSPESPKRTKTTRDQMEIIKSDEDISPSIEIKDNGPAKRNLGRPKPIENNGPMKVEPESIVREIPIKKAKSV